MTVSYMLKKLHITDATKKSIGEKIAAAERSTDGEIVVALAPQSSRYAFFKLRFSVYVGFLVSLVVALIHSHINAENLFWNTHPAYALTIFLCAVACFIFVSYLLTNIPFIESIIISRTQKTKAVSKKAFQAFFVSNVSNTKNRSGILIYISALERQLRITADIGINKKIDQSVWNDLAHSSAALIGQEKTEEAICSLVEKCGELLAHHFPNEIENKNELSNSLLILGDN